MTSDPALQAWRQLLGAEAVLDAEVATRRYIQDTSGLRRRLRGALRPDSSMVIPEILAIAATHGLAVHPLSSGHNWGYGSSLPSGDDGVILDLSRLNRILDLDPDSGVVSLEPGVTQGQLADYLREHALPFLVPVTGAGPSCSLVGNALERGYGITPQADHFAAITEIRAVLADGSHYQSPFREFGCDTLATHFPYGIGPHSLGLFTQGGFGVVTAMSIALQRRPEVIKAFFFSVPDEAALPAVVARVASILERLGSTVGGINLMNRHRVLAMSMDYPQDQLGPDGCIPEALIERLGRARQILPWTGFGTLYGTRRMVRAAEAEIRATLRGTATRLLFLDAGRARTLARLTALLPGRRGRQLAQGTRTLPLALELVEGRPNETALPLSYWRHQGPRSTPLNPAADGCGLLWYAPLLPMRPQAVAAYRGLIHDCCREHGFEPLITLTSLNHRLFDSTVPLLFDRRQAGAEERAFALYETLLEGGRALGFFPYRMGVASMGQLAAGMPQRDAFNRRLKAALDPQDLIAPGRYISH